MDLREVAGQVESYQDQAAAVMRAICPVLEVAAAKVGVAAVRFWPPTRVNSATLAL